RPGPLRPGVLRTLLAVVDAVIGRPVESDHYERFLRWHAEHLPGYRALCEQAATLVEQAAVRTAGPAFAECDLPQRIQVVTAAASASDGTGAMTAALQVVRSDLLLLFSRTDAWILAGYDSWPGVPRGLLAYQSAPVPRARP